VLHFLCVGFIVFLNRHFGEGDGILQFVRQLFVFLHAVFQLLDLLQNLAGVLLVVPEVFGIGLLFQFSRLLAGLVNAERAAELFDLSAHLIQVIFCFFQCNDQDIVPPKYY
jgi:hypothetical protein